MVGLAAPLLVEKAFLVATGFFALGFLAVPAFAVAGLSLATRFLAGAARALLVFVAVAGLAAVVPLLAAVLVRAAALRALARPGRARGSDARMPPSGIESASRPLRLSLGLIVPQSSRTQELRAPTSDFRLPRRVKPLR